VRPPIRVERSSHPSPEDRRDCPGVVFDEAVAVAAMRMNAAYDTEGKWAHRVRAAVLALLELLDEEREIARLCVGHAVTSFAMLMRRGEVLGQLTRIVDQGRSSSQATTNPPRHAAEGVLGGALGLIYAELIARDPRSLVELLNPLMFWIVLPYLGVSVACEEQVGPPPAPCSVSG
jgi:hypothetical protein